MKGINLMKTNIQTSVRVSLFLLSSLFFLLSCEQPFRAGLGPVVDVRPPTIRLEAPGAGSYIWGSQKFIGDAEDDYILERVELMITNQPNLPDGHPYKKYTLKYEPITLTKRNINTGDWYLDIDTTQFADGDLKLKVMAIDSAKKTAELDEIVFLIRNEPPAITVTAPYIPRGEGGAEGNPNAVGGDHLNYGVVDTLPAAIDYPRTMTEGNHISGMISFEEDIYMGSDPNRYPPQIRIWPIDMNENDPNSWPPGVLPPESDVQWQPFPYRTGNPALDMQEIGVGSYSFVWNLPDAGRFYGFEIRAQSKDGRSPFHYPRDFYPNHEATQEDWLAEKPNDPFIMENRYVLIYINVQSEFPRVELYKLEDLYRPGAAKYPDLQDEDGVELNDKQSHPYVNKIPVNKNGPFTLRIKASHSERIQSAEVYWTNENTGQRGRFIWDPAITPTDQSGATRPWDASWNVATSAPYSFWGHRNPFEVIANTQTYTTRNFIFTYLHESGKNMLPNTAAYHPEVKGKSQIQVYKGSDWQNRSSGDWPNAGVDDSLWADIGVENEGGVLSEGRYTIEVYAWSEKGAALPSPFTCTVQIDTQPPDVEIIDVDGKYSLFVKNDYDLDGNGVVVNGVVRPRLRFSDSRSLDSGLRTAVEDDYFRNGNVYGYEERYIIVGVNDNVAMNNMIGSGGWWPPVPENAADNLIIDGVTVYKHGPIFNSEFKFKATPVYIETDGTPVAGAPGETAGVEKTLDKGTYWLYVFVRDNAYNVGTVVDNAKKPAPLKVIVDKDSDIPEVVFPEGEGLINGSGWVTDPNDSADNNRDGENSGFWIKTNGQDYGRIRNKMGANTQIRVTLKDDDSLDLGDANDNSTVTITFKNSKVVGGKIVADDDAALDFTATVKELFRPPELVNGSRRVVNERSGSITQSKLLELMAAANAAAIPPFVPFDGLTAGRTTIPDGIYEMSVAVNDYPTAKLTIGTTPLAATASSTQNPQQAVPFWIAVDSVKPVIVIDPLSESGTIAPVNGLSSVQVAADPSPNGIILRGTVTDRNGPITISSFTITGDDNVSLLDDNNQPENGGVYIYPNHKPFKDIIIHETVAGDIPWAGTFEIPIRMDLSLTNISVYNVTLQVRDRFGNTSDVKLQYEYDIEPPKVSLRQGITRFERALPDTPDINGIGVSPSYSATTGIDGIKRILTNGVASFVLNATDNRGATEVRWWLLKHNTAFTGWGMTTTGDEKHGAMTNRIEFNNPIFIDTTTLADATEYFLYAMARDAAGNLSNKQIINLTDGTITPALGDSTLIPVTPLSDPGVSGKVYVLQEQDKPYFSDFTIGGKPAAGPLFVVGENNMIIRGKIDEDDSFNTGNAIRIWMSNVSDAGPWTAAAVNTAHVTQGVNLTGSRNINLDINLKNLPGNPHPFENIISGDGQKWVKIRATDYWDGKYVNESGTPANGIDNGAANPLTGPGESHGTVSREVIYTFMLDVIPPAINLTSPVPNAIFGAVPTDFNVTGTISDANLRKDDNGNYYITYYVDGDSESAKTIVLGDGINSLHNGTSSGVGGYITSLDPINGVPAVHFNIPSAIFINASNLDYATSTISPGQHSITFRVEDLGNKTGTAIRSFTKDNAGPAFAFLNIKQLILDANIPAEVDWLGTTNYNKIDRDTTHLTVLWHDGEKDGSKGAVAPFITGTFTDAYSNINKATFRIWFDDPDTPTAGITIDPDQFDGLVTESGKQVRWTVYLTQNGKEEVTSANKILADGVHTIGLEIKDVVGNTSTYKSLHAFRINSLPPEAAILTVDDVVKDTAQKLYGDSDGSAGRTVFTLKGVAKSRNLTSTTVTIRHPNSNATTVWTRTFAIAANGTVTFNGSATLPTGVVGTLTFPESGATTARPNRDILETLNWTLPITKQNLLDAVGTDSTGYMTAGTYTVSVVTTDMSGKSSEAGDSNTWTFTVDRTRPEINITNLTFNDRSFTTTGNGTNNNIQNNTRYFTYANHGLTVGDTVVVDNTNRYVLWVNGNNFKLSNTYTWPTDAVWNPGASNITVYASSTTPNNTNRGPADFWTAGAAGAAGTTSRTVLSTDPAIKGRVSDANDLDAVELQLARWVFDNASSGLSVSGTWQIYNFNNNTWVAVASTPTDNTVNDDYWTQLVKPVDTTKSSSYTMNWEFKRNDGITALVDLKDGFYSVRMRARDISKATGGPGWGTANNGNPAVSPFAYFFIDTTPPDLTNTEVNDRIFSSRYITAPFQYGLPFKINATDNNRFGKIEVHIERVKPTGHTNNGTLPGGNTGTDSSNPIVIAFPTTSGIPTPNTGVWSVTAGVYTATATLQFTPRDRLEAVDANGVTLPATGNSTTGLPDGAYKIVFKATDLAGKTSTDSRTITLDNRSPTAAIEEPSFFGLITSPAGVTPEVVQRFASDIIIGGDEFAIKGSSDDLGDNGSASGPKEIWYRIGYGTQDIASLQAILNGTETAAQRSAKIAAWAKGGNSGVSFTGADTGAANNAAFDAAAQKVQGSLWFKYTTPNATYDAPTGITVGAIDPYKWSLAANTTVATGYAAGGATLGRTTTYNTGTGPYLARLITETQLPVSMRRGGLYSLPLVIRVVDNAGNVFYELRDIWLYPNGDIPSSVFINPAESVDYKNTTVDGVIIPGNARGGQISVEGMATDNRSVRTVIYRVKVDNNETFSNGTVPPTGDASIVDIPGAAKWEEHNQYGTATGTGMLGKWNSYGTGATPNGQNVTEASGTGTLSKTGWYVANLESKSFEATSPWYFPLNANNEITDLITTKGFVIDTTRYIRVWIEVFVFDGVAASSGSAYNRMSMGDGGTTTAPRPYVREFYFTTTAPQITATQITGLGNTTFETYGLPANAPVASNYIRSGNFQLRATLRADDNAMPAADIGQISVRLRAETESVGNNPLSGWRDVYVFANNTGTTTLPNGVSSTTGLTWSIPDKVATLTYAFNSTAATSTAAAQAVRLGAWGNTNGGTSGGTYTVEVRVRNRASPPSEEFYTFEVGVDNYAPIADTSKFTTSSKVAGSDANFLGRVFDYYGSSGNPSPPHQGIKDVEVWFSPRGSTTQFFNLTTGQTVTAVTAAGATKNATSVSVWPKPAAGTIGWNGDNVTSITDPKTGTLVRENHSIPDTVNTHKKVLNAAPQARASWSPSTDGADVLWGFLQDTTIFPDGWMTMHYVVTDNANNRSYYTQDMVVMNKSPQITKVTLNTNNVGQGAVFTSDGSYEYDIPEPGRTNTYRSPKDNSVIGEMNYSLGYLNSGFISKNRVVGFGVKTLEIGNPPFNYQVRYVERYLVRLTTENLAAMRTARTNNTTASLKYIADTVTLNEQGRFVLAETLSNPNPTIVADPTTYETSSAVGGFVNLYTIATGYWNKMSASQWRDVGLPLTNPVDGAHFVFDPSEGMSTAITGNAVHANYPAAYVYAYREVGVVTTSKLDHGGATNFTNVVPASEILPAELNITGSTYFDVTGASGTKIPEALAENRRNAGSTASGDQKGTAFFLLKVWDTVDKKESRTGTNGTGFGEEDMLYDAVVIGMRVYIDDKIKPVARLYDLNPYIENAVIRNNLTQTIADAAKPTAIGANVKRGGLYNLGTEREPIKSGYIDPRGGTSALNPYVTIPDNVEDPYRNGKLASPDGHVAADGISISGTVNDKVSGTVLLRGIAWDDQLIDKISVTIGSTAAFPTTERTILQLQTVRVNANGTETIVPDGTTGGTGTIVRKMMPVKNVTGFGANGATLPAGDTYTYLSQTVWTHEEINWQTGHTVEWAYLWNTENEPSRGTNVVGGGPLNARVAVTVKAINGSTTPVNNQASNVFTVTAGEGGAVGSTTNAAPPASFHNILNVDIVPYVTGFERDVRAGATPLYSTKRSRQGWYSFFRGEGNIAVNGFNLGTATLTMDIQHAAGSNTGMSSPTYNDAAGMKATNPYDKTLGRHTFGIDTSAQSGKINITAGGTAIYNHTSSHTNKSWNREHSEYATGSDLWNNKPYAHIWDTGSESGTYRNYIGASGNGDTSSVSLKTPGMALEYSTGTNANPGRLHGAWATYVSASYSYGNNNNAGINLSNTQRGEPFGETDISIFNGLVNNTMGNNTNASPNVTAVFQQDGNPFVTLSTTMRQLTGTFNTNLVQISDNTSPRPTQRWKNTRVSKAAANTAGDNPGRAYITAYDSSAKRLFYAHQTTNAAVVPVGRLLIDGPTASSSFTTTANGTNNNIQNNTRYFTLANHGLVVGDTVVVANTNRYVLWVNGNNFKLSNSYTWPTDNVVWNPTANNITYTFDGMMAVTYAAGNAAASASAGEYNAIDYDSTGPIIAYYDETNDTVRLAFGANTTPTSASGQWTRRYLLPTDHALRGGSGQYISLKVDRRNGIHLAFYNSTYNTVVYAYARNRNVLNVASPPPPQAGKDGSGNPNTFAYGTTDFYVCTIDNVVRGGQWTDISVDNRGNPMIVYGDSSRMGNYDGARIAYLVHTRSASGDTNSGTLAQNALQRSQWETLYCPITGANITGWEAVSLPSNHTVNKDRLNVEVWPPTNRNPNGTTPNDAEAPATNNLGTAPGWSAAVGYASDRFRVGYFFYPTWKDYP